MMFTDSGSLTTETSDSTLLRTWWVVLHFRRIQPEYAGNYTCMAKYRSFKHGIYSKVEVRVLGKCIAYN